MPKFIFNLGSFLLLWGGFVFVPTLFSKTLYYQQMMGKKKSLLLLKGMSELREESQNSQQKN